MDSYFLSQDQRGCSFVLSLQQHVASELGLSFNKQDCSTKLALEVSPVTRRTLNIWDGLQNSIGLGGAFLTI